LNKGRDRKQPNIPLGDLFKFFKNPNKAPDELLVQQLNQGLFPLGFLLHVSGLVIYL
jgi:hypothetical protein